MAKEKKHKEETLDPIETLQEEMKGLKKELEETKDKYFRALAELENMKKRMTEEMKKERKYASFDVSDRMIEPIDIFTQALQTKTEDPTLKNFLYGFNMIKDMVYKVLEDEGVKLVPIKVGDSFDPLTQHAIESEYHADIADQSILRIVKNGYYYKDRLLRPVMVVINVHPKAEVLEEVKTEIKEEDLKNGNNTSEEPTSEAENKQTDNEFVA